jgi:NAD(P)-dependent dehydrogenase (short-subunit alcohol dehydrogenase family)
MGRLEGRVTLIKDAASGIGAATAARFAAEGAAAAGLDIGKLAEDAGPRSKRTPRARASTWPTFGSGSSLVVDAGYLAGHRLSLD